MKRIPDIGYYIPFAELTQCLLHLPEFRYWTENDHFSYGNFMHDICDGNYVKQNPFFQRNSKALKNILYNDDLEIVNPLETHVKKHKITLFYVF